ncbi:hypothetical protein PF001_g20446 [Phytophthora fragariae]|uniref:Uncharacterized protein n=2 Tax=Phytophthora fragariae TaxID=53985 RepID=A0A6A4CBQ0_9STRA|nr:hypothetical protein PF001_g20446 [Phytophthora fragariae]
MAAGHTTEDKQQPDEEPDAAMDEVPHNRGDAPMSDAVSRPLTRAAKRRAEESQRRATQERQRDEDEAALRAVMGATPMDYDDDPMNVSMANNMPVTQYTSTDTDDAGVTDVTADDHAEPGTTADHEVDEMSDMVPTELTPTSPYSTMATRSTTEPEPCSNEGRVRRLRSRGDGDSEELSAQPEERDRADEDVEQHSVAVKDVPRRITRRQVAHEPQALARQNDDGGAKTTEMLKTTSATTTRSPMKPCPPTTQRRTKAATMETDAAVTSQPTKKRSLHRDEHAAEVDGGAAENTMNAQKTVRKHAIDWRRR